jgi:hypothetical protein
MSSTEPVIHMPQDLALPRGRLMFAIDATASREATWALARQLQGDMFRAAAPVGKLEVQLVFYRGQECRSSKWLTSGERLAALMNKVHCVAGMTQIGRVFGHALREHEKKAPVGALTVIADAFEENVEDVAALASKLGMVGCPIFMFQDVSQGRDATARNDEIEQFDRGVAELDDSLIAYRLIRQRRVRVFERRQMLCDLLVRTDRDGVDNENDLFLRQPDRFRAAA